MRYTVRVAREGRIDNVFSTDDEAKADKVESEYKKEYGKDNVWIADAITEFLVG